MPSVVGGEEDVAVGEYTPVRQPAHDTGYEVVERLQRFGPLFGSVVYVRYLGIAEPRQLPYPGGFVCDIRLVEGRQAPGFEAVVGVLVARCWRSRTVRGPWRHVGEEGYPCCRGGADEGFCVIRYHVRFIVCRSRAVVDDSAIVVDLVIVVTGAVRVREPPIPARRFVRGAGVFIEVLAEEACPVTRRIQTRRHVVLLVAVVPVSRPAALRTLVAPDPVLWAYWPLMMVARVGQQSALETKAFEKVLPLSPSTERVFGMYLRSSLRMSSASMKTILGLAVAPSSSRAALLQTPDTSSTAKATATDNVTVLLMSTP